MQPVSQTLAYRTMNISTDIGAAVELLTDPSAWTVCYIHSDFAGRQLICTDGFGCLRMGMKLFPEQQRFLQLHDANMKAADKLNQLLQAATAIVIKAKHTLGIEEKHFRLVTCDVSLYGNREGQEGFDSILSGVCERLLKLGATMEVIQIDHHLDMASESASQMVAFLNRWKDAKRVMRGFTVITSNEVERCLEPSSKTLHRIAEHAELTDAADKGICYLSASTDNFLTHFVSAQAYLDSTLGASYQKSDFILAVHRLDAAVQRSREGRDLAAAAHGCLDRAPHETRGQDNYVCLHMLLEAFGGAVEGEVQASVRTLKGQESYELLSNYPALFYQAFQPQNVMLIPRQTETDLKVAYFPHAADSFQRATSAYVDDLCDMHELDGVFFWKEGTPVGSVRFNRAANLVGNGTVMAFVKANDMEIAKGILAHFEPQAEPSVLGQPNLVVIQMLAGATFNQCQLC
jgi:hypothetical protein